jgi:hypothetical protein
MFDKSLITPSMCPQSGHIRTKTRSLPAILLFVEMLSLWHFGHLYSMFSISEIKGDVLINYLGFLALVFSGIAVFFGLPLPGTFRIASTTEGSYIAVGPAYPFGFIFFLISCIFTAPGFLFSSFAISAIVMPSILQLSAFYIKKLKIVTVVQNLSSRVL